MLSERRVPCLRTAQLFADALNRCDFAAARNSLADGCVNAFRDNVLTGRDAIMATYQKNAEWAEKAFDRIFYESRIASEGADQVRITFVDRTEHQGIRHQYICPQLLTFDYDYTIKRIEHVDLEGQAEALEAFLRKCGASRRAKAY